MTDYHKATQRRAVPRRQDSIIVDDIISGLPWGRNLYPHTHTHGHPIPTADLHNLRPVLSCDILRTFFLVFLLYFLLTSHTSESPSFVTWCWLC